MEYVASFAPISNTFKTKFSTKVHKLVKHAVPMPSNTIVEDTWLSREETGFGVDHIDIIIDRALIATANREVANKEDSLASKTTLQRMKNCNDIFVEDEDEDLIIQHKNKIVKNDQDRTYPERILAAAARNHIQVAYNPTATDKSKPTPYVDNGKFIKWGDQNTLCGPMVAKQKRTQDLEYTLGINHPTIKVSN